MKNRKMNLGDVVVGTCYVSALRGTVVSIVRVAHTDAEKRAMFGAKYKKTQTNDAPMWEAIGNNDGKKHISGSADDLHKLIFVPKTDPRWFDPSKPKLSDQFGDLDNAIETVYNLVQQLKDDNIWGATTLESDLAQFDANFSAIRKRLKA